MHNRTEPPRLQPWYVHLFGGWSIGALLPWYLVCSQYYARGRRRTAWLLAVGSVLLFALYCGAGYLARLPWDGLMFGAILFSIAWSVVAWLVQRRAFGPAPRRFYVAEWRSWLAPIAVAVILGIGLAVAVGIVPLIGERIRLYQSPDLLARKVILWDFFRFVPCSLLYSLPVGIWWAGERDRFNAARPVAYFFGLLFSVLILYSGSALFYFLLLKGEASWAGVFWPVMPELQGVRKSLYVLVTHDYSFYFAMPLLFGAVGTISEFFKRSLAIFPALVLMAICMSWYSPRHWQASQSQIFYEMSSNDPAVREKAYDRAEVLLARFPEHDGWQDIASRVAEYRAKLGDRQAAKELYSEVIARTRNSARWYREAALAEAFLGATGGPSPVALAIPSLHYETYMTGNWMALLRNLRFYEGATRSETDTLIRLKGISTDDEKIKLAPMPTLAELDDNAALLGYQVLILPSELVLLKKMIAAGMPVIQPVRDSFYLLSGFDESRGVMTGSNYGRVLAGLKKEDREGVASDRPLLSDRQQNPDGFRPSRIDLLAEADLPFSFWRDPRQGDFAALVAVVFPPERRQEVIAAIGGDEGSVAARGTASLTGLIALSALNCGDVIQTVSWAKRSYELEGGPFTLRVAHLAELLWQSRSYRVESGLHLERRFPNLEAIDRFLAEPPTREFLDRAAAQFEDDFAGGRLDWISRHQYRDFLDLSSGSDRQRLIVITEQNLRLVPDDREEWLFLAGLFEWEKNFGKAAAAYRGALEAGTWNDTLAVRLASLLVRDGRLPEAETLLGRVDRDNVKFQPDYFYCLASLADRNHDFAEAAKYFDKAINMRRYDSRYHLDYAGMLDRLGEDADRAGQLKRWGKRLAVDAPDHLAEWTADPPSRGIQKNK